MLRKVIVNIPRRVVSLPGLQIEAKNASTVSCAKEQTVFRDNQNKGWHILSAVCVERLPVIVPEMTEMEAKVFKYFQQKDHENSLKSDHELRHEREKGTLQHTNEKPKDGIDYTKQEIITATEMEDTWKEELATFELEARTHDDTDLKSLERKLDKNLTLLVEQKIGEYPLYLPPQTIRQSGETMRDAAERCLNAICGPDFKVRIYGNAPFGFTKYSYPKKYRTNGIYGAKVFYFLGKYCEGNIQKNTQYKWLDRTELNQALPDYLAKPISKFLLPD